MLKQPNSRDCFLCGIENPVGLHLTFYEDEDHRVIADLVAGPEYQGYPGVLHGGIVSALLDETIGRALVRHDLWAMTVELKVRFLKPVPLGEPLRVVGEITRLRSRTMEGVGEVCLADGTVAARAEAKYVLLSHDQEDKFRTALSFWEVVPDETEDHAMLP